MREFEHLQRLDYLAAAGQANPALAFDHLFQLGRGHMFGVLECEDRDGRPHLLRAFSSLYGGIRQVDGWVDSLLSMQDYEQIVLPAQAKIKEKTAELQLLEKGSLAYRGCFEQRKRLSQELFARIPDLYEMTNFRGETRTVREVFPHGRAMPGGVGDCCAPKLLNHAARHNLRPISLAEFYWGGSSETKRPGQIYPCCEERCRPILGFLLCGMSASRTGLSAYVQAPCGRQR